MRKHTFQSLFTIFVLLLFLMLARQTASQEDGDANTAILMAFAEAEAARDYDALAGLLAEDFVRHSAASDMTTGGMQIDSREAYVQFLQATAAMFPDYRNTPNITVADDEYVAFYNTFTGHVGESETLVEMPIMGMVRIQDGQIAEMWVEWDNLSWNAQMGGLPTEEPVAWHEGKPGADSLFPPHACPDGDLVENWGTRHPHG